MSFMALPHGPPVPVAVLFAAEQTNKNQQPPEGHQQEGARSGCSLRTRYDASVTVLPMHMCHERLARCSGIKSLVELADWARFCQNYTGRSGDYARQHEGVGERHEGNGVSEAACPSRRGEPRTSEAPSG
jgi:hypothetical protein